ncbi:Peptidase M1 [Pseudoloma neurophilia]|uniref:Aminopeptidase n=1 Tax=Pseudoloma neurophilia TaxID=146866 RepID=A0A0R0M034_9MICR|nr:Peptidase M1 [Pseudoloma neurophilia]
MTEKNSEQLIQESLDSLRIDTKKNIKIDRENYEFELDYLPGKFKLNLKKITPQNRAVKLGYNLDVVPEHYDLIIELDSENDRFRGIVTIDLYFKSESDKFMINAEELCISQVLFENELIKSIDSSRNGNLDITLCEPFKKERAKLQIYFDAEISKSNFGFYLSTYGKNKKIYSTYFDAENARMAFPCFDHPIMKATFEITIIADKKFDVISNMPVESEHMFEDSNEQKILESGNGVFVDYHNSVNKKVVKFRKLKKTSTYLVAYAIGQFNRISEGIISVYSLYDAKLGEYALKIAVYVLDFFVEYFNMPFPLEKLDLIGIPRVESAVMQNWGMITFRHDALMYDRETYHMTKKISISDLVSRGIAHQWFGNLVTTTRWDDSWLYSGFAAWAAPLACDALKKSQESNHTTEISSTQIENSSDWQNKNLIDWEPWLRFISTHTEKYMRADANNILDPLEDPFQAFKKKRYTLTPSHISKSAALLRMFENFLTPSVFQERISQFVQDFALSNATIDEFFTVLFDNNEKNIQLAYSWIFKKGFPSVEQVGSKLVQSQIYLNYDLKNEMYWPTPVQIRILDPSKTDEENVHLIQLNCKTELSQLFKDPVDEKCIFLNDGGVGCFRTRYKSPSKVHDIFENLSTVNRLVLINDQSALSVNCVPCTKLMLKLCDKLQNEQSYEVLNIGKGFLLEIENIFWGQNEFIFEIVRNMVKHRLNFDFIKEEPFEIMHLRSSLLYLAVNHGIEVSIPENCHNMYRASYYIIDFQKHGDIRKYLKIYKKSKSNVKYDILLAMTKTQDFDVYKKVVDLFLSDEIKEKHKAILVKNALNHLKFKKYFINYFVDNFTELRKKIGDTNHFKKIFRYVTRTLEDIRGFKEKMLKHEHKIYKNTLRKGIKVSKGRLRFRKDYLADMAAIQPCDK